MLDKLGYVQLFLKVLYTDSKNVKNRVLNRKVPGRNRYIDVRFKQIIENVKAKEFDIIYIKGEEIIIDSLTKPLKADKYIRFVVMLGLEVRKVLQG